MPSYNEQRSANGQEAEIAQVQGVVVRAGAGIGEVVQKTPVSLTGQVGGLPQEQREALGSQASQPHGEPLAHDPTAVLSRSVGVLGEGGANAEIAEKGVGGAALQGQAGGQMAEQRENLGSQTAAPHAEPLAINPAARSGTEELALPI